MRYNILCHILLLLYFYALQVSSGYLVVVFVYVTEFTGIKVRTWTSMHVHAAFAVGIMVVALTGYLVRVWWIYQIILSTCTSPFLLFCWKFPETPFYLMAKGRYSETQNLLDSMAQVNGIKCSLKAEELLEPKEENGTALLPKQGEDSLPQSERKLSILDLFGSWRMAGRTCTVWAIWFIGSLGYYVFSLGSVNLGGNQYVNLFLVGKYGSGACTRRETFNPSKYSIINLQTYLCNLPNLIIFTSDDVQSSDITIPFVFWRKIVLLAKAT